MQCRSTEKGYIMCHVEYKGGKGAVPPIPKYNSGISQSVDKASRICQVLQARKPHSSPFSGLWIICANLLCPFRMCAHRSVCVFGGTGGGLLEAPTENKTIIRALHLPCFHGANRWASGHHGAKKATCLLSFSQPIAAKTRLWPFKKEDLCVNQALAPVKSTCKNSVIKFLWNGWPGNSGVVLCFWIMLEITSFLF